MEEDKEGEDAGQIEGEAGAFILILIPNISIAPLQVHYYSKAHPTTSLILCRS